MKKILFTLICAICLFTVNSQDFAVYNETMPVSKAESINFPVAYFEVNIDNNYATLPIYENGNCDVVIPATNNNRIFLLLNTFPERAVFQLLNNYPDFKYMSIVNKYDEILYVEHFNGNFFVAKGENRKFKQITLRQLFDLAYKHLNDD